MNGNYLFLDEEGGEFDEEIEDSLSVACELFEHEFVREFFEDRDFGFIFGLYPGHSVVYRTGTS